MSFFNNYHGASINFSEDLTKYQQSRNALLKNSELVLQAIEKEYLLKDSKIANQAVNTGNSTTQADLLYSNAEDYQDKFQQKASLAEQNLEDLFLQNINSLQAKANQPLQSFKTFYKMFHKIPKIKGSPPSKI